MSCEICGADVASSRGVTCSYSCRARLREKRKTREWRRSRDYAADLVERIRRLYAEDGLTIAEVQAIIGHGVKVQLVIERYAIPRRRAVKRNQRGERNDMWRGPDASYGAVHLRLLTSRGPASAYVCSDCGAAAAEWAYDYGCPNQREDQQNGYLYSTDLSRYSPRCRPCHQQQDRERDQLGRFRRKAPPHV